VLSSYFGEGNVKRVGGSSSPLRSRSKSPAPSAGKRPSRWDMPERKNPLPERKKMSPKRNFDDGTDAILKAAIFQLIAPLVIGSLTVTASLTGPSFSQAKASKPKRPSSAGAVQRAQIYGKSGPPLSPPKGDMVIVPKGDASHRMDLFVSEASNAVPPRTDALLYGAQCPMAPIGVLGYRLPGERPAHCHTLAYSAMGRLTRVSLLSPAGLRGAPEG
jgi:hypothetical protein